MVADRCLDVFDLEYAGPAKGEVQRQMFVFAFIDGDSLF